MSVYHRQDSLSAKRLEEQELYVASRDYQVTKAARLKKDVDSLYPGHTKWYNKEMEILHGMEEELQRENPEEWEKALIRRNAGRPPEE
jgi:hypothetical protein